MRLLGRKSGCANHRSASFMALWLGSISRTEKDELSSLRNFAKLIISVVPQQLMNFLYADLTTSSDLTLNSLNYKVKKINE